MKAMWQSWDSNLRPLNLQSEVWRPGETVTSQNVQYSIVFSLNIRTPYMLIIFVLKFEIVHSTDVSETLLHVW